MLSHRKSLFLFKSNVFFGCYRLVASTSSYQHLHKSSVPTFHHQNSLPRLPIPELNKTCQRYLEALKPIVSQEQHENTANIVKQFACEEGPALDAQLRQHDKTKPNSSWLSEWWFDLYLSSRIPLPLNFNPYLELRLDPRNEFNSQLLRAANLAISCMRFRRSLVDQVLEPDVAGGTPLDMSQFERLFGCTRIPRLGCDEWLISPDAKHILVMKGGHFFVFDMLDADGRLKEPSYILSCFKFIMDQPTNQDETIAVLTSEDRNQWGEVRKNLVNTSLLNRESIDLIDSAQFVLCLDDFVPHDLNEEAHNFLHGCRKNSKLINRWFDKSFSLILTADGKGAINFEHSWGDGITVLRLINDIFADSTKNSHVHSDTSLIRNLDFSKEIRQLKFQLSDSTKSAIQNAMKGFRKSTDSLQLNVLHYDKMNRDYFKKKKLSPDSMFQLAFQLAYHRVYNSPAATYESCSTAAFKHGRTETLRSATSATKKTSEAFLRNQGISVAEKRALLDECSKKHVQISREAAIGQGFDRHLFGLRKIASILGKKQPEIYNDPSYSNSTHYRLSTSALYSKGCQAFGFGPVVDDGFGLGYGYLDNSLFSVVSAYEPHKSSKQFADSLHLAFDEIYHVLE